MKHWKTLAGLLAIATLGYAADAAKPDTKGVRLIKPYSDLKDLTPEQTTQLKEIHKKYADQIKDLLLPVLDFKTQSVAEAYQKSLPPMLAKAVKDHRALVQGVRRGDTVITSGGFVGKVTKAADNSDEVEVELSDNMRVRVLKSTLMDVRAKGEAVKEAS